MDFSVFTYLRYLNQLGLDDTYTDAFGRTKTLDLRKTCSCRRSTLLQGLALDPNFRYVFFTWTANTNPGQGAQVVVAGNLATASMTRSALRPESAACRARARPTTRSRTGCVSTTARSPTSSSAAPTPPACGLGQSPVGQVPGHARQQPEPAGRRRCELAATLNTYSGRSGGCRPRANTGPPKALATSNTTLSPPRCSE